MGSKKMKIVALVAIVAIGVMVGVAVWPTPKPALASTTYSINLHDDVHNSGVEGASVVFSCNGFDECTTWTDANGDASYLRPQVFPSNWKVRYSFPQANPSQNDAEEYPVITFHQFVCDVQ